jgi:ABC-type multidrug transport system fused ATPase/permease subunit
LAVVISTLDFLALVILFPVFGALASGDGGSSVSGGPFGELLAGISAGTLILVAMALMIGRTVAAFAFRFWWSRTVAEAEVYLSSRLLHAYSFAEYSFHLRRNSADLLARSVSNVNVVVSAGLDRLVFLAIDTTTVLALGAALFVVNPVAAGVVGGYLALLGGLFLLLSRRFIASVTGTYSQKTSQVYRRVSTVLRGIRELTVSGGRERALGLIGRSRLEMALTQRKMQLLSILPNTLLEVGLYVGILCGLLLVLASSDQTILPVVALYVVAGLQILPATARGVGNLAQVRVGVQMARDIGTELEDLEATGKEWQPRNEPLPRQAVLRLESVGFGYLSDEPVLRSVSLRIPFGTSLAVMGPSGSGKTTLLGILLGLLSPTSGVLSYGGRPIGVGDPEWLRLVGYVAQDVFLLDDSILANVALGDVAPDRARAWTALERAALGGVVGAMASGLDSQVGEGGSRLSIGQRQRLGLARALYRDPTVLILDEPTAALDRDTEMEVLGTIRNLYGAVTVILVSHRAEPVEGVDHVVRLVDGKLTAADSSCDLLGLSGGEDP